ncbi:hypothetical protein EAI_02752 [Harpegnathos saltator]|uniref:Uncharacterized protein n=1 Tax=Harpegnathos saltator TaxID=610380 RepID=E2B2K8_HARSA|nr:hypothetical protein EAI_02752 [Harpegnathos saltator]
MLVVPRFLRETETLTKLMQILSDFVLVNVRSFMRPLDHMLEKLKLEEFIENRGSQSSEKMIKLVSVILREYLVLLVYCSLVFWYLQHLFTCNPTPML